MEQTKDKLLEVIVGIQQRHEARIKELAKDGKHIGLERLFRNEIEKRYGVKSFGLTDQERGNLSLLIRDLGPENVGSFLIEAVAKWKELAAQEYLKHLPPTPVFKDLFFNRQRIQSCLVSLDRKEEKVKSPLEKIKEEEKKVPEGERKSNLLDMVKEEIRKQREIKERKMEEERKNGGRT